MQEFDPWAVTLDDHNVHFITERELLYAACLFWNEYEHVCMCLNTGALTQASWQGFNDRLQLSNLQGFPQHLISRLHLGVQIEPANTHMYVQKLHLGLQSCSFKPSGNFWLS